MPTHRTSAQPPALPGHDGTTTALHQNNPTANQSCSRILPHWQEHWKDHSLQAFHQTTC